MIIGKQKAVAIYAVNKMIVPTPTELRFISYV